MRYNNFINSEARGPDRPSLDILIDYCHAMGESINFHFYPEPQESLAMFAALSKGDHAELGRLVGRVIQREADELQDDIRQLRRDIPGWEKKQDAADEKADNYMEDGL